MILNRRQFFIFGATLCAGCAAEQGTGNAPVGKTSEINAGPASQFERDGVYSGFRDRGFFVIREGARLFALSAVCTHRKCTLAAETDRSFFCKCHGSTFDPGGHVTLGPARRDLPVLDSRIDEKGRLLVTVPA